MDEINKNKMAIPACWFGHISYIKDLSSRSLNFHEWIYQNYPSTSTINDKLTIKLVDKPIYNLRLLIPKVKLRIEYIIVKLFMR